MITALKAQSTHRPIPIRRYVYEQLALSKPGFWADWKKRTVDESEEEPFQELAAPPEMNRPSKEHRLGPFKGDPDAKKEKFKNDEYASPVTQEPTKKPPPTKGWIAMGNQAAEFWLKQNPLMDSGSSTILESLEKHRRAQDLYRFQQYRISRGIKEHESQTMAQFIILRQRERDAARAKRPFGYGEPTNFDKMVDLLHKPKPPYTPPTFEVLKQGTTQWVQQVPNWTVGNLNVAQNGYASNPTAPKNQAKAALAGRMNGPINVMARQKLNLGRTTPSDASVRNGTASKSKLNY